MAMDAILAVIAAGGRANVDIIREADRNKSISHLIYYLILQANRGFATDKVSFLSLFILVT